MSTNNNEPIILANSEVTAGDNEALPRSVLDNFFVQNALKAINDAALDLKGAHEAYSKEMRDKTAIGITGRALNKAFDDFADIFGQWVWMLRGLKLPDNWIDDVRSRAADILKLDDDHPEGVQLSLADVVKELCRELEGPTQPVERPELPDNPWDLLTDD